MRVADTRAGDDVDLCCVELYMYRYRLRHAKEVSHVLLYTHCFRSAGACTGWCLLGSRSRQFWNAFVTRRSMTTARRHVPARAAAARPASHFACDGPAPAPGTSHGREPHRIPPRMLRVPSCRQSSRPRRGCRLSQSCFWSVGVVRTQLHRWKPCACARSALHAFGAASVSWILSRQPHVRSSTRVHWWGPLPGAHC